MKFWQDQPALYYGLYILLGAAFALFFSWVYFLPLIALAISYPKRAAVGIIVAVLAFACSLVHFSLPAIPEEGVIVEDCFKIDNLTQISSPFGKAYLYTGKLGKIPCCFTIPIHKYRPAANADLHIKGRLLEKGSYRYVLKQFTYQPIPKTWSAAEIRWQIKQMIYKRIRKAVSNEPAAALLNSMITGDIDDRTLTLQFKRLGLQHILGVSGLQFAAVASLLGMLLRPYLNYRRANIVLLICITIYFLILGDSPPVQRAWIGLTCYLVAILAHRPISALNALGLALGIAVVINPLVIANIGFQLSFTCTFALLSCYPLLRRIMKQLMPHRSFNEVRKLSLINQHNFLLLTILREGFILNITVHLLALPILISRFHIFPMLSLIYNLVFTPLITICYGLSLIGLVIPAVQTLNGLLCSHLLSLTTNPPSAIDFCWRANFFSLEVAVIILTLICIIPIVQSRRRLMI